MQIVFFIVLIALVHIIRMMFDKGTQLAIFSRMERYYDYEDSLNSMEADKIPFIDIQCLLKKNHRTRFKAEVRNYMPLLVMLVFFYVMVNWFNWSVITPAFVLAVFSGLPPIMSKWRLKHQFGSKRSANSFMENIFIMYAFAVSVAIGMVGFSFLLIPFFSAFYFAILAYLLLLFAARSYEGIATFARRFHVVNFGSDASPDAVLYLRSFKDEFLNIYNPAGFEKHWLLRLLWPVSSLEDSLSEAVSPFGELLTLGVPKDIREKRSIARSAYRYYAPHDSWEELVEAAMLNVKMIVVLIGSTDSLATELAMIKKHKLESKTMLVFPPYFPLRAFSSDKSFNKLDGSADHEAWIKRMEKTKEFYEIGEIWGGFNPLYMRAASLRDGEVVYSVDTTAEYFTYTYAVAEFLMFLEKSNNQ